MSSVRAVIVSKTARSSSERTRGAVARQAGKAFDAAVSASRASSEPASATSNRVSVVPGSFTANVRPVDAGRQAPSMSMPVGTCAATVGGRDGGVMPAVLLAWPRRTTDTHRSTYDGPHDPDAVRGPAPTRPGDGHPQGGPDGYGHPQRVRSPDALRPLAGLPAGDDEARAPALDRLRAAVVPAGRVQRRVAAREQGDHLGRVGVARGRAGTGLRGAVAQLAAARRWAHRPDQPAHGEPASRP